MEPEFSTRTRQTVLLLIESTNFQAEIFPILRSRLNIESPCLNLVGWISLFSSGSFHCHHPVLPLRFNDADLLMWAALNSLSQGLSMGAGGERKRPRDHLWRGEGKSAEGDSQGLIPGSLFRLISSRGKSMWDTVGKNRTYQGIQLDLHQCCAGPSLKSSQD